MARDATLSRRSDIRVLHPFVDDQDVAKVDGHLKHTILSRDERHPIILPQVSRLTTLIVNACHRKTT